MTTACWPELASASVTFFAVKGSTEKSRSIPKEDRYLIKWPVRKLSSENSNLDCTHLSTRRRHWSLEPFSGDELVSYVGITIQILSYLCQLGQWRLEDANTWLISV